MMQDEVKSGGGLKDDGALSTMRFDRSGDLSSAKRFIAPFREAGNV